MLSAPKKGQTSLVRCGTVRWKRNAPKSVPHWTLCSVKIEALLQPCVQTLPRAPQHSTDSSTGWRAHRDTQGSLDSLANPSCYGQALASLNFAIFYQYLSLQRQRCSQSSALSTLLGGYFASGLSGLAHSRFPWGILSPLAPHEAHLVRRRGCDLPEGLPGASRDGPWGTQLSALCLGCMARAIPGFCSS